MAREMKYFVVHVIYLKPFDEVEPFVEAHRAYLDRCLHQGSLLLSGPLVPRTGGLLFMRGEGRPDIERTMAGDPYALAGVARYEVLEFKPLKVCAELSVLLEGS